MEWSNETARSLIDLYRDRPVLWNCRLKEYKDRNKRHDAFVEIAEIFGVPKEAIERKMKNLICHFSREVKKERDSAKSGTGSEDVYKSKWFAYQSMEFLKDRNQAREMTDAQDPLDLVTPQEQDEALQRVDDQNKETPEMDASTSTSTGKRKFFKSHHMSRKRFRPKRDAAAETLSIMKKIQPKKYLIRDKYALFGEQVGLQLRDLPSLFARKVVRQIISTVLFDAEMGKYDSIPCTSSEASPVVQMYSQPPMLGVPMCTSMPGTSSSISQMYQVPNRIPLPSYSPQHSAMSPASFTDFDDPETTESDTDNL